MKPPNPGSSEAIKQGCACPVLDNNHGHGFPTPGRGLHAKDENGYDEHAISFWINGECQLHGRMNVPAAPSDG